MTILYYPTANICSYFWHTCLRFSNSYLFIESISLCSISPLAYLNVKLIVYLFSYDILLRFSIFNFKFDKLYFIFFYFILIIISFYFFISLYFQICFRYGYFYIRSVFYFSILNFCWSINYCDDYLAISLDLKSS